MNNTYKTVSTKVSAPANYTFKVSNNTLIGSSIPQGGGGGSNGYSYVTNTSGYTLSPTVVINNEPSSLEVKGKIVHNGRDLEERLSVIEKVLQIPERDVILEKKYPKLKKMYDEYIKELSKVRMWESLKGDE
jgi:hypothetical protein